MPKTYLFSDDDGFKHFAIKRFDIDENGQRNMMQKINGKISNMVKYSDFKAIVKM